MIKLEKHELEPTLLLISTYDKEGKKLESGLLSEAISLGTKRRLQKIHKELYKNYLELIEDVKQNQKECGEDQEKLKKENEELLKEVVEINAEPVSLALIENITTNTNYNFTLIEKIAV